MIRKYLLFICLSHPLSILSFQVAAEDLYFGEMEQNIELKITETYPQSAMTRYQAERALSHRVKKNAGRMVKEGIQKELTKLGVPYAVQYLSPIQDASKSIWISSAQHDDTHFIKANPVFNCSILTLTNQSTELTPERVDRFDIRVFGERGRLVFERTKAPAFLLTSSFTDYQLHIHPDQELREQIVAQLRNDGDRLYKAKVVLTLHSMTDRAEWKMSGPALMDFLELGFKDQIQQCVRFLETRLSVSRLLRPH
jgi:hypothetical protein